MSDDNGIIDLDDPSLQEEQHYDPTSDINSVVVPPEIDVNGNAITYQLKLDLGENKKVGKPGMYFKKDKNSNPFGVLPVDFEIVQPGGAFDKVRLKTEYYTTMLDRKHNTTAVVDLAFKIGQPMSKGLTLTKQKEVIEPLLLGNPIVNGNIQWSAYCRNCQEEVPALQGERNWPEKKNDKGEVIGHVPTAQCPDCKMEVNASASVRRLLVKK